jgi:hypothetical protein
MDFRLKEIFEVYCHVVIFDSLACMSSQGCVGILSVIQACVSVFVLFLLFIGYETLIVCLLSCYCSIQYK